MVNQGFGNYMPDSRIETRNLNGDPSRIDAPTLLPPYGLDLEGVALAQKFCHKLQPLRYYAEGE